MSEFLSMAGDLYAFAASQPAVIAACVAGLGGLVLGASSGRRTR